MNLPASPEWTGDAAALPLAAYGRRIVAWIVDLLIFLVPAVVLVLATVDVDAEDPAASVPFGAQLALSAAFVAYQTIMVAWRGQTVGAMSMSIMVVRLDTMLKPGWSSAGIRSALRNRPGDLMSSGCNCRGPRRRLSRPWHIPIN